MDFRQPAPAFDKAFEMRRARKKEITMNDVAVACGVSYQTVSRAINGMEDISEETRSRILKMVDKLGYRPNMAARHLASRQSSVIGIVTSDISFYGATQVMLSAGRTAREAGYALMLAEIQDESLDEIHRAVNEPVRPSRGRYFALSGRGGLSGSSGHLPERAVRRSQFRSRPGSRFGLRRSGDSPPKWPPII